MSKSAKRCEIMFRRVARKCLFHFLCDVSILCAGILRYVGAHLSLFTSSLVAAHFKTGMIAFLSSMPSCVSEYSTRGGISAKDSLMTNPSACSSFKVSDNVFGLIPFNSFISPLNLSFPRLPRALMIKSAHFLLMTSMTPLRGQKQRWRLSPCMSDYFPCT